MVQAIGIKFKFFRVCLGSGVCVWRGGVAPRYTQTYAAIVRAAFTFLLVPADQLVSGRLFPFMFIFGLENDDYLSHFSLAAWNCNAFLVNTYEDAKHEIWFNF